MSPTPTETPEAEIARKLTKAQQAALILAAERPLWLAGTEHCDWDCGRLNEQRIAGMKRRAARASDSREE